MNITHKNGKIIIELTATNKGTPSKSGKSTIIESTHGFMSIPDTDLKISINLIK